MAHIWDVSTESPSSASVTVISKFHDICPIDFPNMPLVRDIKFCINLELGVHPISIPFYHMDQVEIGKLKIQLQE